MSSLTECNYCIKKRIEKKYKEKLVRLGNEFYVEDEEGKKTINGKKVSFIVWLMEIPNRCCCD